MKAKTAESDKPKRNSLVDVVIEQAEKSTDLEVKGMLFYAAASLDFTAQKEAKKRGIEKTSVFTGICDPEALACFFFDLLLLHNPSYELRDALLQIAEELSAVPACNGHEVEKYLYEARQSTCRH